ncbi:MAG: virulence-associated E family protein [Lachnospiraceae bacterium]|nr:virulence-associated E family protein [Lachnospiraceae bacterium]
MQNNRKLQISTGGSRKAMQWPKSGILWSEFVEKLRIPVRGTESLQEYLNLPKSQQDELKDVGGFVGGTFTDDRRKAAFVEGRDLITLDLDNIPSGQTEDILRRIDGLGCAAAVYSTRKHSGYAPRLRIIIPADRTASADEYEPAARKLASLIGIEFCDPTTFEASRLMYWPSCSSDSVYVCEVYDKPFCSLDGILGMYGDWHDVAQWPQVPGTDAIERRRLAKQEDPTRKRGIIGAFCRTYSITQAMDRFIPGMYEETDMQGRYTYTGGSTVGGAIVYDGDLFLYSHHATDPCSGQLVNAFDLVRLHLYGDKDDEAKDGTPVNKLPSFVAMSRMALDDKPVADLIAKEKHEEARAAFALPEVAAGTPAADDLTWISSLSVDGVGNYQKTINNLVLILQNDPLLKGRIVTDEFAGCGLVLGALPWNKGEEKRRWVDRDDDGALWYMETYYHIPSKDKLSAALSIVGGQNTINEVRDYLKNLRWDGTCRVDTLLSQYLGADDNKYTRAVIRKALCAAVARAMQAGVKYDYMPIFTGPQGIGKSTFLNVLGKSWFSDSLTSFEGKEAAELIQGTWINEIGELTAMTRQETSAVKQFLSKKSDIYRAAYGRRTEEHPRRCVFFGTSNDSEFLKDRTGNRRFWPVDVGVHPPARSVWQELPGEVDQIWAEAYLYWSLGEPLYMSGELANLSAVAQEEHRESNDKEGLIQDFLERPIPSNWDQIDLGQRRAFWSRQMPMSEEVSLVRRERVCAIEIWVECFGADKHRMRRIDSIEINGIMEHMAGWERIKTARLMKPYGNQKGFRRI